MAWLDVVPISLWAPLSLATLSVATLSLALLSCNDERPAPQPKPAAASAVGSAASASASTASAPPPVDSATIAANHKRLQALVPPKGTLPPGCVIKPIKDDAPAWLPRNPHIDSNPSFIRGFVKAALPGADARQIDSGLYAVFEAEDRSQVGLFVFAFRAAAGAAFGKQVFAQSRPAHPERFAVMQRDELLLVQWRDGEQGPCWDALRKWTLSRTKREPSK